MKGPLLRDPAFCIEHDDVIGVREAFGFMDLLAGGREYPDIWAILPDDDAISTVELKRRQIPDLPIRLWNI